MSGEKCTKTLIHSSIHFCVSCAGIERSWSHSRLTLGERPPVYHWADTDTKQSQFFYDVQPDFFFRGPHHTDSREKPRKHKCINCSVCAYWLMLFFVPSNCTLGMKNVIGTELNWTLLLPLSFSFHFPLYILTHLHSSCPKELKSSKEIQTV